MSPRKRDEWPPRMDGTPDSETPFVHSLVSLTEKQSALTWGEHPQRTSTFDDAILSAGRRDWHPLTINLGNATEEYDLSVTPLLRETFFAAMRTEYVRNILSTSELRARFVNTALHIYSSDILYGERAALSYAARFCLTTEDLGALENSANQAREEARHVSAFSFYIRKRWISPSPITPIFGEFLQDICSTGCILKEIAGTQVLLEGLAMGIFTALDQQLYDPLMKVIIRHIMADEASHVRTGAALMKQALRQVTLVEREEVARWLGHHFMRLRRGLFAPTQHPELYESFNLDPRRVNNELRLGNADKEGKSSAMAVFRTAAIAIKHAGLITARTKAVYNPYLA
jgi:hypothetical protein